MTVFVNIFLSGIYPIHPILLMQQQMGRPESYVTITTANAVAETMNRADPRVKHVRYD